MQANTSVTELRKVLLSTDRACDRARKGRDARESTRLPHEFGDSRRHFHRRDDATMQPGSVAPTPIEPDSTCRAQHFDPRGGRERNHSCG